MNHSFKRGTYLRGNYIPSCHLIHLCRVKHLRENTVSARSLKDIPTISEVEEIKRELDVKIAELKANQFWVEKRAVHSILPVRQMIASILGLGRYNFYRRRPQCGQLYF